MRGSARTPAARNIIGSHLSRTNEVQGPNGQPGSVKAGALARLKLSVVMYGHVTTIRYHLALFEMELRASQVVRPKEFTRSVGKVAGVKSWVWLARGFSLALNRPPKRSGKRF